jgi:eukaryotic-like serine/threonine-protein kinase
MPDNFPRPTLAPPRRHQHAVKDDMTGALLLGRYRIVRRLSSGGMGVVYLARVEGAEGFVKPVVVKRVLPQFASERNFVKMFIREAQLLASLNTPGIANVLDFERIQSGYLMVLEYVHGFEVREWMKYLKQKERCIPTEIAIAIAISVLTTLQHVHGLRQNEANARQIVHRDVTPSNIMVDVEGRIKLVDFGIAWTPEAGTEIITGDAKLFKGKFSYAAPELLNGQPATPLSDIYACGVTLHEMLVGYNTFAAGDPASTIRRIMTERLGPIHDYRDDAPSGIDGVIGKATEPNPRLRFQSAEVFAEALRQVLPVREHDALRLLGGLAHADFNNDDMPEFLGVESLGERERAWRSPSVVPKSPDMEFEATKPGRVSSLPRSRMPADLTEVQNSLLEASVFGRSVMLFEHPDIPTGTGTNQQLAGTALSRSWLLIVLGIISLLSLALVFIVLFRTRADDHNDFVVVQSPLAAHDAVPPAKEIRPNESEASLDFSDATKMFAKNRNAIIACFKSNAVDIPKARGRLSVLFHVLPSGSVERAEIRPETLMETGLGRCIVDVARATVFPRSKQAHVFAIPMTTHEEPQ